MKTGKAETHIRQMQDRFTASSTVRAEVGIAHREIEPYLTITGELKWL